MGPKVVCALALLLSFALHRVHGESSTCTVPNGCVIDSSCPLGCYGDSFPSCPPGTTYESGSQSSSPNPAPLCDPGVRYAITFMCSWSCVPNGSNIDPDFSPTPTKTPAPTKKPTKKPTGKPTKKPTSKPTRKPTKKPTKKQIDCSINGRKLRDSSQCSKKVEQCFRNMLESNQLCLDNCQAMYNVKKERCTTSIFGSKKSRDRRRAECLKYAKNLKLACDELCKSRTQVRRNSCKQDYYNCMCNE